MFFIVFVSTRMIVKLEPLEANNCIYSMNGNILECKNLIKIDDNLGAYVKDNTIVLFLRNCKHFYLDEGTLTSRNYEKLTNVHIIDSEAFELKPNGLIRFKNVKSLRINKNQWKEISNNVFFGKNRQFAC